MATADAFWDKVAPSYAKRPVANPTAYEQTLARTRSYLNTDMTVVELGCGTGTTALKLADAASHIHGTDVSRRMVGLAHDKANVGKADNLSFAQADVAQTKDAAWRYDAVLAFNLLHLVPDLDCALRDIHALLTSGGVFVSKTPCVGDMNAALKLVLPVLKWVGRAPEVNIFGAQALEHAVETAGFEILESRTFHNAPHNRFVVARRLG